MFNALMRVAEDPSFALPPPPAIAYWHSRRQLNIGDQVPRCGLWRLWSIACESSRGLDQIGQDRRHLANLALFQERVLSNVYLIFDRGVDERREKMDRWGNSWRWAYLKGYKKGVCANVQPRGGGPGRVDPSPLDDTLDLGFYRALIFDL